MMAITTSNPKPDPDIMSGFGFRSVKGNWRIMSYNLIHQFHIKVIDCVNEQGRNPVRNNCRLRQGRTK